MRPCAGVCVCGVFALSACLSLIGQPGAPSEKQKPTVRTTTRAVVVDVVATKGEEQVVGLHKEDFEVLEDRKLQAVNFFEEHSAKTLPPGALLGLPRMPPGVYTNVPPAPPSDSVNVLLIDMLNTDPQDQANVRQQILNFLKNMQSGIRVAVFTLSSRLRMVQGFTTDSAALRDAVDDKRNGVNPQSEHSVTRTMQDKFDDIDDKIRMALISNSPLGVEALGRMQAQVNGYKADQRVVMTLEALQGMARYLAGVPGRKNLVWFSTSFPITVFPSSREKQALVQSRQYSAAVKQTADLLTVSKVAVYPIGAEGMMVDHAYDTVIPGNGPADVEGGEVKSSSGRTSAPRSGDEMTPYVNENPSRSDRIAAMEELAADTGGKAYYNTNDLNAAMQKAIADGAHYYTLAYTPTNKKMDGSYRRIEVKVKEAKYRLAYRRGYNADELPPVADAKASANPLHGLMSPGMPEATEILFAARVTSEMPQPAAGSPLAGKNAKLTGPTRRYAIDFMIRWTDVKLEAQADGTRTGKVQLELLAFDSEGNAVNWSGGTEVMNLKPEVFQAIEKSGVPAHAEIDLPADKDVLLEAGVYDWQTGKAGTMRVVLKAGGEEKAAKE